VLVVEQNFAEFSGEIALTTSGSVTRLVFGMVRQRWKDPAPSAMQTQELKTKVSPLPGTALGVPLNKWGNPA
jgi:hypothetical protein